MLQDFSEEDVLEKIKKLDELKKQLALMQDKLAKIDGEINYKEAVQQKLKKEIDQALAVKEESNILSKIASRFHKGKYFDVLRTIEDKQQELIKIEDEIKSLVLEGKEIIDNKKEMAKEISDIEKINGIECIRNHEGKVLISELNGMDRTVHETSEIKTEETVIVHCTNFFPNENTILSSYEGGKINSGQIRYRGVLRELHSLHHREEVHCTLNNRVENTSDGAGKWDDPSYIIVDRFDEHQKNMEAISTSDSWTNGTNMTLSKDAVIMVRLQDKDKLPISEQDMENYRIIYYEGSPTACLRNFLALNNYDILKTDPNSAGHAKSLRMALESALDTRDLIINCVMDDTWFGKNQPVFSSEEISKIMDVIVNSNYSCSTIYKDGIVGELENVNESEREAYVKILDFAYTHGLKKGDDGKYVFGNKEDVLNNLKKSKGYNFLGDIELNGLVDELLKMQQEYSLEYESMQIPNIEEIFEINLGELYKFENQLVCESVKKSLPSLVDFSAGKKKFDLSKTFFDSPGVDKKVNVHDNVEVVQIRNDGLLTKKCADGFTVGDIESLVEELDEKFNEISGRTVREVGIDR